MINKLAEEYMDHIDRDKRKNEKTSGRSNVTAKQEDHILRLLPKSTTQIIMLPPSTSGGNHPNHEGNERDEEEGEETLGEYNRDPIRGKGTVADYTGEFLRLQARCNLRETDKQSAARLISDEELEYVEPLDGEAEQVTNIVQRTLCSPKVSDSSQRNKILQTKCLVNEKICSIIIDEGSCENLMSKELVKAFKLPTEPHLSPYQIGWIKKGSALKLTEICKIPLAIGKHYNELVTCDFVDMETCHVLLERPWKQDVDATHQVERKKMGVSYDLVVKGVEDVMGNAILMKWLR
ncbi:transposon ty3-I gag-pol polyprotein [Tanacetum coccineum]